MNCVVSVLLTTAEAGHGAAVAGGIRRGIRQIEAAAHRTREEGHILGAVAGDHHRARRADLGDSAADAGAAGDYDRAALLRQQGSGVGDGPAQQRPCRR